MQLEKLPWQPAIYEHKAALIGCTPLEVACDADLFVEALLKEHEVYEADFLTVGLDVYNVEAEALGAELTTPGATILLCDYAANAAAFKAALGDDSDIRVRRNISPASLESGDPDTLACDFVEEIELFSNPIAGTGILPYGFDPAVLQSFMLAWIYS